MAQTLNPQQQEAINYGTGPLLVIAGAGTGKTTVITQRISNIIKEKLARPEEILALTFTDKAASEMQDRLDKMMPYGYTQMYIQTFHAFADTILRQEAIAVGLSPAFKLMTETESILFLKKNLFKLNLLYFRPLGNPNKFLDALLTHFSRLQDEDITPDEYLKFAEAQNSASSGKSEEEILENQKILELANVYKQYTDLKLREGVLDFSDIISQTLNLLRKRKNILERYREQFKFILVDEFQDTNFAQNELAILLAGNKKNITVVADDDQAIYRWRGAALSNVLQFKNNFPGAKIITLTKNYRSTQEILDRSYELIQHNNPNRLEAIENISKKLISQTSKKGEKIEFIFKDRVDEEAEEIAKKIKSLTRKKYKYQDIAILVRANNHSQPITTALARNKIPYQFLGPGYLFQQEEIKDLIAYFKVLYNLEDSVSLYRILNMDVFKISARDINHLLFISKKRGSSLFETMEHTELTSLSPESKNKIEKITKMILRHLERAKKDSPGQILYFFLLDSGLLNAFLDIKSEKDDKQAKNIAKFFDKIKTFETLNQDANIYSIVDWIDLIMEMGDSPLVQETDFKNVNAVNILTIHSSKGLEFPIVFMINLVNDRFPSRERREKIPLDEKLIKEVKPIGDYHLQEERRLFYVGMTRAKELLFFTGAKFYSDGKREKKISPFVFEAIPTLQKQVEGAKKVKQLSFVEAIKDYQIQSEDHVDKINEFAVSSLSYSQLQAFDVCPLHFKARFLLRLPTPQTAPLSFGISIHNTFNTFYENLKNGKKQTLNDFLTILEANWISEGYQEKTYEKKMYEAGENIIKKYYKDLFEPENLPLSLELPFSFFIKRDSKPPVKILGKIDRVDKLSDGKIEIIDYKTGKSDGMSKANYKLQLGLYALAATEINDNSIKTSPDKIKVSLLYLEEGIKKSEDMNQEEINDVRNIILQKISEIEKSDFKCSKSILCKNCEYKMLCNSN